jgi:ubiquinone/menaquinone biosynthesis C-methylase UbiE
MKDRSGKQDKLFPLFVNDNLFRRLFLPPSRLTKPFVAPGQTVADIGCGPGYYTMALAKDVGPEGKVYAVDVDEKPVRALEKKAGKRGLRNIETHVTCASDLGFIPDASVDFVLANGLLCSMAPRRHESTLREMKRILKPGGRAYLSVAWGPWSHVDGAEWKRILEEFRVERRAARIPLIAHRWALVSLRAAGAAEGRLNASSAKDRS